MLALVTLELVPQAFTARTWRMAPAGTAGRGSRHAGAERRDRRVSGVGAVGVALVEGHPGSVVGCRGSRCCDATAARSCGATSWRVHPWRSPYSIRNLPRSVLVDRPDGIHSAMYGRLASSLVYREDAPVSVSTGGMHVLERDALRRAVRRARAARLHAWSARRCATARSSTTSSRSRRRPARRLDRRAGRRHLPARAPRRRRAVRLRRRARTRGSASCSRPSCGCGRARRDADGGLEVDRGPRRRRRATRSSACARATCTRSRSRTASSSTAATSTPTTRARREGAFIVAVNCGQAGGTCFCVSMDTGPRATRGFDLALTELLDDGRPPLPRRGRQRARAPRCSPSCRARAAARRDERGGRASRRARTAAQMGRELDTDRHHGAALPQPRAPALGRGRRALPDLRQLHDGLPDLLLHARVEDVDRPRRRARPSARGCWDSCFTLDYSYIHGGSVRALGAVALPPVDDPQARDLDRPVRHLGCVGCGRCITWCPVGIDITEEAAAIRATEESPMQHDR